MAESSQVLPFEIVDHIIDILSVDDENLPSLKNCSLVCTNWRYICRPRIWADIIINFNYAEKPRYLSKSRFVGIIGEKREVGGYIRRLEYRAVREEIPSDILQSITHLVSFKLLISYWDWEEVHPKAGLLHLACLPSLTSLDLVFNGVKKFPITKFINGTRLKRLSLYANIRELEFKEEDLHPLANPPRIEELTLFDSIHEIIAPLLAQRRRNNVVALDFSHLKKVFVQTDSGDDYPPLALLVEQSKVLEELEITLVPFFSADVRGLYHVTRHVWTTLRILKVSLMADAGGFLARLTDELVQMRGKNVLTAIIIEVGAYVAAMQGIENECHLLDQVLTSTGWDSLSKVALAIEVHHRGLVRQDAFRIRMNNLLNSFQNLTTDKDIEFQFSHKDIGYWLDGI